MKTRTILTRGALAATALVGAIAVSALVGAAALPAMAQGWGPQGDLQQQMMQMVHGQEGGRGLQDMGGHRGGFMQGHGGHGRMMGPGGRGPMGMGALAGHPLYQSFDADADGTVTAAELEAGLAGLLATHDADGDGGLSAEEFEALVMEASRGFAERPFTMLDADRDGTISAEEMVFPAQMMARMELRHADPAAAAAE